MKPLFPQGFFIAILILLEMQFRPVLHRADINGKICIMSFNHTLSAIFRGPWMLERRWAESHLPLVLSLIKGNPVSFVDRSGNEQVELPFAIDPKTMHRYEMYRGGGPNANIPSGSVGVIPISGPITKYNGECGEPGAIQRASWFNDMQRRDSISSVVMLMDTPGGETRAASSFTTAIGRMTKPVLAYVDGTCASLGMWLAAAADEVYMSSELDELGSIGSYAMLSDFKGYLESQGLKIHEVYAPQSVDKNKDYRDAMKGDYAALEGDLKLHVDHFINAVKSGRPKAAAFESEWGTGKMFYAKDAQRIGLSDGVRTFQQVISKAAWNAKMNKKKSI
jgi:protease IV